MLFTNKVDKLLFNENSFKNSFENNLKRYIEKCNENY